jgi:hypothetical protein
MNKLLHNNLEATNPKGLALSSSVDMAIGDEQLLYIYSNTSAAYSSSILPKISCTCLPLKLCRFYHKFVQDTTSI